MSKTRSADEKKQVLSGLGNVAHPDALAMAGQFVEIEAVRTEAAMVTIKIAAAIGQTHPDQAKTAIEKVLSVAQTPYLREQAQETLRQIEQTQGELVQDTMVQAGTSLTETEAECDRIADCLTEGKTAEAMEALGKCMAVWQQIHDGVSKSLQLLRLDVTQIEIDGEPLIDLIARPKDVLLQVKQALECQDHVLLADTLKYEFSDVIREWHTVLAVIRRHADPREATTDASN